MEENEKEKCSKDSEEKMQEADIMKAHCRISVNRRNILKNGGGGIERKKKKQLT